MKFQQANGLLNLMTSLFAAAIFMAAIPCRVNGQGMGGGGMGGGYQRLEVVLMLGPEFDYQSKPFASAPEIVRAFHSAMSSNGVLDSGGPTLASVRVDVTTKIPDVAERRVVAFYPTSLVGSELEEFKKFTQMTALPLGITKVDFEEDGQTDKDTRRIWLRAPYVSEGQLAKDAKLLREIAVVFAGSSHSLNAFYPRLDLFPVPRQQDEQLDGMDMGMGGMDMGMDDYGMDSFGMGMGIPTASELEEKVRENSMQRGIYEKRMSALVTEMKQSPEEVHGALREQLAEIVRADETLHQANQTLEVQQLEAKLQTLRERIAKQTRLTDEIVRRRVQELLAEVQ